MSSIPNEKAETAHHLDDKSKGVIDAKQAFEKLVTDQKEHPGHADQKSHDSKGEDVEGLKEQTGK